MVRPQDTDRVPYCLGTATLSLSEPNRMCSDQLALENSMLAITKIFVGRSSVPFTLTVGNMFRDDQALS